MAADLAEIFLCLFNQLFLSKTRRYFSNNSRRLTVSSYFDLSLFLCIGVGHGSLLGSSGLYVGCFSLNSADGLSFYFITENSGKECSERSVHSSF